MKNRRWTRIFALSFLFLMNPMLLSSKAQSQSTLPKLEGSAWRVTTMNWYNSKEMFDIPIVYGFVEKDKVEVLAFVTIQSLVELSHVYLDPNLGWQLAPNKFQTQPVILRHPGTYKQDRNSIHLEFADHIIDATINGNRMEGEIRSTENDPKPVRTKWSAERISKNTTQSEQNRSEEKPRPDTNESSKPGTTPSTSSSTGEMVGACGVSIGKIIADKWLQAGGGSSILGCPYSGEVEAEKSSQGTTGRYVEFKGNGVNGPGSIYWHRTGQYSGQVFIVRGGILQLYKDMGRGSSWLGFPITDQYEVPTGARSNFEGGYIYWDKWTGLSRAFKYN